MDLIEISGNSVRHPWETARKAIVEKFITRTRKKDIRFLDVGSGDAYVADGFTRSFKNSTAYCVDSGYSQDLIDQIEKTFQNNQLNLYADLSEVKLENVDIVTLLDVIEHVPDDTALLNSIIEQPYVKKGTFFIITVPAFQSLFSHHDVLLKHFRRYNLRRLKEAVGKCNLEVITGGYFFSILIGPRLIQIFKERISSEKAPELGNLGTWKGGKLISRVIKTILMLDYQIGRLFRFFGVNLPGLSCYIVCQKK